MSILMKYFLFNKLLENDNTVRWLRNFRQKRLASKL